MILLLKYSLSKLPITINSQLIPIKEIRIFLIFLFFLVPIINIFGFCLLNFFNFFLKLLCIQTPLTSFFFLFIFVYFKISFFVRSHYPTKNIGGAPSPNPVDPPVVIICSSSSSSFLRFSSRFLSASSSFCSIQPSTLQGPPPA